MSAKLRQRVLTYESTGKHGKAFEGQPCMNRRFRNVGTMTSHDNAAKSAALQAPCRKLCSARSSCCSAVLARFARTG